MRRKGLIDKEVTIKMQGGMLRIEIEEDMQVKMTGVVRQICEGVLSEELIEDLT